MSNWPPWSHHHPCYHSHNLPLFSLYFNTELAEAKYSHFSLTEDHLRSSLSFRYWIIQNISTKNKSVANSDFSFLFFPSCESQLACHFTVQSGSNMPFHSLPSVAMKTESTRDQHLVFTRLDAGAGGMWCKETSLNPMWKDRKPNWPTPDGHLNAFSLEWPGTETW